MQTFSRKDIARICVLVVVFLVCVTVYLSRSQSFPVIVSKTPAFTNGDLIKDVAPQATYDAIVGHIGYYLAAKNIPGTTLKIADTPYYSANQELTFKFQDPAGSSHTLTVNTLNYGGGLLSNAVSVDGTEQDYGVLDAFYSAQFNGFEVLTNSGMSAEQAYGVQQALNTFSSNAYFALSGSPTQTQTATGRVVSFQVSVNGATYSAQASSTGLTDVRLVLVDASKKQVLDSGVINIL